MNKSEDLNINDNWYIKINNSIGLSECKIKELTEKTVLLEFNGILSKSYRYTKSDVQFIEKLNKGIK